MSIDPLREEKYLMITYEMDEASAADDGLDRTSKIESVAIQRMIEEVRSGDSIATAANYNRTHNKHNR
jgi:hypothetical protein